MPVRVVMLAGNAKELKHKLYKEFVRRLERDPASPKAFLAIAKRRPNFRPS